jgi:tetratricopeptide (TPR) repeat protein
MRWIHPTPVVLVFCALAVTPAAAGDEDVPPAPPAGDDANNPAAAAAREAYNQRLYPRAARLFLEAVQAEPSRAELYRSLARARVWAEEHAEAVVAYRFYLELAPGAEDVDKVQKELRAKTGVFAGPDGAYAAFDEAIEAGFLGPDLTPARAAIDTQLTEQSADAVDRWWRLPTYVAPKTLDALHRGWRTLGERRTLSVAERTHAGLVGGLHHLAEGAPEGAIEALGAAPGDARVRYAQVIALARAGRRNEAHATLEGLIRTEDEPRFHLLAGLMRLGEDDAGHLESLRRGLGLGE